MKKIVSLGMLFCAFTILSNAQSWTYSNALISEDGDVTVIHTKQDNTNNTISLGYFEGTLTASSGESVTSYGGRDYFVVKFDPEGNIVWLNHMGSILSDDVQGGLAISGTNDIYISGSFPGNFRYTENDSLTSTGGFDMFLGKLSPSGDIRWFNLFGTGASHQRGSALEADPCTGELLVTGTFKDSVTIYADTTIRASIKWNYLYAKVDTIAGDLVWVKSPLSFGNGNASLLDIEVDNNEYYFTGTFSDSLLIDNDTIIAINNTVDSHTFKTDSEGSIIWIRKIQGDGTLYSQSLSKDNEGNVFVIGGYTSSSIFIDSTNFDVTQIDQQNGSYDFFISKYASDGSMLWTRVNGGKGEDRLADSEFYNNEINVAGLFSDTISWGGISLSTNGTADLDMFTGSIDKDGNYRNANSFGGRNNSTEDSRSIFSNEDNLFNVIRSNSDLLILGDSIYTTSGNFYYVALGITGCLPISIDQVITQDVQTCYQDSSGSIQILASGGFGAPWQYSIDNGLSYQEVAYFADLPAGDYPIVVIDAENCAQPGPMETVTQPEPLSIELISEEFTGDSMVNIVVAAYGGTEPYTFTLQPNGIVQAFGDFSVKWSEPGYYVVEVTDLSNCGPVVTDTLTTSSGIDLFAPGVKLYPNPTSGIITVEVPFQGSACTLEVLSLTGQVMFSRQVYSNGISINETIDLSDLSKGMYMIRVDGQTLKSGVVVN